MTPETIQSDYPEMTDDDYLGFVQRWLSIDSKELADQVYEADVLPRSCYLMRLQAVEKPVDLLLVPVGTQPYAPLMSCLGKPAQQTVLLMTAESRDSAMRVEEVFAGSRRFLKVLISANDSGDIVRKTMSVFDTVGQPRNVVCDVTGGTKIMTATLAGLAAMNGWRQVYVDSKFIRNKGSHSERLLSVTSAFEHLGGWHSAQAWKLASVGQFGEAAKSLKAAIEESVAGRQMRLTRRRFQLAQKYREADLDAVCRSVTSVAKDNGVAFSDSTLAVLRGEDRRGLSYWVAKTLEAEGQKLAAVTVLAGLGVESTPDELPSTLAQLKRNSDWEISAWKPIDDFLGRRLSREAATRE